LWRFFTSGGLGMLRMMDKPAHEHGGHQMHEAA
jgi:hypothetical protein